MTSAGRLARTATLAAICAVLALGCAAAPGPPRTTVPGTPTKPTPSPVPTDPAIPPLPPDLGIPDDAGFAVSATSLPGATMGEPFPFTLGHCGLYSPVDVDGSLWEPIGGQDAAGGPIDFDAEVGQLINATEGEAMLVHRARLDFRTPDRVVVVFRRLDGPRMYPGCQ